jgi:hypothetical protein
MVPQANLTSLDPVWTTVNITRNHGYMVYDTFYGRDADFRAQPQMAAAHVVENDGQMRVCLRLAHRSRPTPGWTCCPARATWRGHAVCSRTPTTGHTRCA